MKPPFSVSGKSYRDSGSPVVSGLSENKSNKPVVTSTNTETVENFSLAGKVIKSLFNVFSKSYHDSNLPLVSKHLENKIDKPIVGSINVSYSPTFSLVGSGQTIREFEIDSVKHVLGRLRTLPGIPLTDDITAFELFSFQLRRTLSDFIDPAGIDDIAFFDTNKGIKDFPIAGDGDIFFQVASVRQDLSLASENFTFQYSKPLQDSFSADESFTFQYGKLPADLTGPITDSSTLLFNKGPSDSANASIALNYIVDKVLSDTALGKDLLGITDGSTFSFGMAESDRAVILEQILVVLGLYGYYSDSAQAFDDNLIFNIFKSLDDQAKSLEDFTFNLIKTLFDLAQANENAVLTFNKSLPLDSASASDADLTFITDKGLSDLFNIIENAIWSFNKGEFDVSNVNENITWLYDKPQFDSAQALENSTWLLNKPQFDISNVSDNQFLNYNKGVFDATELNDEILSYSLQKVLSDISNALDLVGINDGSTFQFNMVEASLVNISESIQLVLQAFEYFTESITLSESLNYQINKSISDTPVSSDSNIFDIQKVYSDISQIIESLSLSFDMGNISESLNVGENSVINTGKNLSDVTNISEVISVLIDLRRFIDDIVNVSEDLSLSIEKTLSDTTLAKDLLGVTDGSTFSFGMVEGDTITSTEDLNLNSNKVLTDLPNIPDDYFLYQQTYFDSDYIVNGQAYVVFNYRSPLVNIFGLPFTEPLNVNENLLLASSKFLSESLAASENSEIAFNKPYFDAINVQELLIITGGFYKALTDTALAKDLLGVTDGSTFTFGMVEGDVANVSEVFTKIVEYNRLFDNQVNISESISTLVSFIREFNESLEASQTYELFSQNYFDSDYIVNGQSYVVFNYRSPLVNIFGLPFTESPQISEIINLYLDKPLSENLSISDDNQITFNKPIADNTEVSESLFNAISKTLADTTLAKDLLGVTDGSTFTFGMVEGDQINISESIFKEVNYNRSFTDQLNTPDLFELIFVVNRYFTESLEADQTYELFTQNYFDSDYIVNGQSYAAFNYRSPTINIFGLPFTESLDAEENVIIELDKVLSDTFSASENNIINFSKIRAEVVNVSETNNLEFNKIKGDQVETSENNVIDFNKAKADQANVTESFIKSYDKSLTDTPEVTDVIDILVQTFKDFIDSTNVSDPYLIYKQNYFDGDTYSIGYAAYEYRSPTSNGYYLPFTNTANVTETSDLNIGKNRNEQITANDQSNLDIDKDISDTAETGDSGVVYLQSYFAEDYVEFTYALESTAF